MLQGGMILSDYATLIVEILKNNAPRRRGPVYGAIDMSEARQVDRAGLRQVIGTPVEVRSWAGTSRMSAFSMLLG
jgi:hypothetical protein